MSMIFLLYYDDEDQSILLAGWPSGLRRRVKAAVRKGVGSNPTPVIFSVINMVFSVAIDAYIQTWIFG